MTRFAHSLRPADVALAVALLASVLMLGPALAHAFELPNKLGLSREQYFVVQQIYRGWDSFAVVLLVQIVALLGAAYGWRRERRVVTPIVGTLLCVAAAQILFWSYTFPANRVTGNWTIAPGDWQDLRLRWEYSHLAGAVLQLIGLASLIVAAVRRAAISRPR